MTMKIYCSENNWIHIVWISTVPVSSTVYHHKMDYLLHEHSVDHDSDIGRSEL